MRAFITENGFRTPKDISLPAKALDKLARFQTMRDDRQALSHAATERRIEAEQAHTRQKREAERLRRELENGRLNRRERVGVNTEQVSADRALVESAEKGVAKLADQAAKAGHIAAERSARASELSQILNAIQSWIENLPHGAVLADCSPRRTAPSKTAFPQRIADLREEIGQLAAERERVVSAPKHSSDAKASARAQVAALAERGRPDVSALLYGDGPIRFVHRTQTMMNGSHAMQVDAELDALALMAWFDPDRLIARLESEIDAEADDEFALADEDRAARLVEIDADRLELERQEEALIAMAEEAGQDIPRRPDASPLAILGIAAVDPASKRGKAA